MTTRTLPAEPGCAICGLGDDRTRLLLAIERNPKATKTHILKSMHITRSREKQRELFESIPYVYSNGCWQSKS